MYICTQVATLHKQELALHKINHTMCLINASHLDTPLHNFEVANLQL